MTDGERRFSLDPIKADPSLKSLIYSADGDETVGEWDGEDIHDLVRELDRIEERVDANYNSLPHSDNIPEDLRGDVEKDCSIWTCDKKGNCLTGDQGADIKSADQIRKKYISKQNHDCSKTCPTPTIYNAFPFSSLYFNTLC